MVVLGRFSVNLEAAFQLCIPCFNPVNAESNCQLRCLANLDFLIINYLGICIRLVLN